MNLATTEWEFRHRFWIISACFFLSFSLYRFDHRISGQALAEFVSRFLHHEATLADIRLVYLVGAILAFVAAALRTWATSYLRPEIMVDSSLHTHTIIADGPYRHVRNPLYLGTNLLAISYALMASRLGAILLIGGIFVFNYRLIFREERELTAAQGDTYRSYLKAVPRLRPSFRPRVPSSGRKPHWGAGLLGEAFFWGLALALFVFSLTFSIRLYFFALGMSFGLYFLCLAIIGFSRKRTA